MFKKAFFHNSFLRWLLKIETIFFRIIQCSLWNKNLFGIVKMFYRFLKYLLYVVFLFLINFLISIISF